MGCSIAVGVICIYVAMRYSTIDNIRRDCPFPIHFDSGRIGTDPSVACFVIAEHLREIVRGQSAISLKLYLFGV